MCVDRCWPKLGPKRFPWVATQIWWENTYWHRKGDETRLIHHWCRCSHHCIRIHSDCCLVLELVFGNCDSWSQRNPWWGKILRWPYRSWYSDLVASQVLSMPNGYPSSLLSGGNWAYPMALHNPYGGRILFHLMWMVYKKSMEFPLQYKRNSTQVPDLTSVTPTAMGHHSHHRPLGISYPQRLMPQGFTTTMPLPCTMVGLVKIPIFHQESITLYRPFFIVILQIWSSTTINPISPSFSLCYPLSSIIYSSKFTKNS